MSRKPKRRSREPMKSVPFRVDRDVFDRHMEAGVKIGLTQPSEYFRELARRSPPLTTRYPKTEAEVVHE